MRVSAASAATNDGRWRARGTRGDRLLCIASPRMGQEISSVAEHGRSVPRLLRFLDSPPLAEPAYLLMVAAYRLGAYVHIGDILASPDGSR